jgi:hypothetical protein
MMHGPINIKYMKYFYLFVYNLFCDTLHAVGLCFLDTP